MHNYNKYYILWLVYQNYFVIHYIFELVARVQKAHFKLNYEFSSQLYSRKHAST